MDDAKVRIKVKTNTQKSKDVLAKACTELVEEYARLCGLDSWSFFLSFKKINSSGVLAETEVEVHYYRAEITFDLIKLEDYGMDRLAEVIRHELLHCVVWRLAEVAQHLAPDEHKDFIQNFEEQVTTDLERLPVWEEYKKLKESKS